MLTFDEANHKYFDGDIELPSVTSLVSILGADSDEMLDDVIDAAADRGTTCHKVLELLLQGETDVEYPTMYEPYVDAIRLLLSEHEIIPIATETPIHSVELGVAGTPDELCLFDGMLTITDWKLVSQICKPKVKAQTNGYRIIYNENGVFPERLIIVQFLNNGLYRIYPVAISDKEFMACYEIHKIKTAKYGKGKID
jgi:hypothetical protein